MFHCIRLSKHFSDPIDKTILVRHFWYLTEVSNKNGFINRVIKMLRKSDTMNHPPDPPNKTTVQSQTKLMNILSY